MDKVMAGFLQRNIPDIADCFEVSYTNGSIDYYNITACDGRVNIKANCFISACNGIYNYLKRYCRVQYSWCGNNKIDIKEPVMFDGEMYKEIHQKYRVYMNYCTLDYTMCWWDFDRWEKEIDFMAMNGINMPLAVIGSEAVWYETLLQFGFTKKEALSTVSGPAFWAWQLMTNIESYIPPKNEKYIYERQALGKKILDRYIEFGMYPIQQGFSGHVPKLLKEKYKKAKILDQQGWCQFPKTAQLDPLDPLFQEFGTAYLKNLDKLLGFHHFVACDPFHEGTPPKPWRHYLKSVGKSINKLYENFDSESVWVMQAWSMRKHIVKAVPKNRLLILDLNSQKTIQFKNMWGYSIVSGMLHDFGGKNAMQGKLEEHCKNAYKKLKDRGANVVGTGMFMEAIEQNPVIYELQFQLLTSDGSVELKPWLKDYLERRYGKSNEALNEAWDILLKTCYLSKGYQENEVGSMLAANPNLLPEKSGPCDKIPLWYNPAELEKALPLFLSVSDEFKDNDGYQYDLCDLVRQIMSNRFYSGQTNFKKAYENKNLDEAERIAHEQLELLYNLDEFLSHRSEMCLSKWINDSHRLATDDEEKKYFDYNARTLITLWGDVTGDTVFLSDYSWREWSGLIKEYYAVRWEMFYNEAVSCLKSNKPLSVLPFNSYEQRKKYTSNEFGKNMLEFELGWGKKYSEYSEPQTSDATQSAKAIAKKFKII